MIVKPPSSEFISSTIPFAALLAVVVISPPTKPFPPSFPAGRVESTDAAAAAPAGPPTIPAIVVYKSFLGMELSCALLTTLDNKSAHNIAASLSSCVGSNTRSDSSSSDSTRWDSGFSLSNFSPKVSSDSTRWDSGFSLTNFSSKVSSDFARTF